MPYDKDGNFIPNENIVCKRAGIEQEPPAPADKPKPKKPK